MLISSRTDGPETPADMGKTSAELFNDFAAQPRSSGQPGLALTLQPVRSTSLTRGRPKIAEWVRVGAVVDVVSEIL
jgi:hypothetical protein